MHLRYNVAGRPNSVLNLLFVSYPHVEGHFSEFTTFFLDPIGGVHICYHPLVTLLTHFQKNRR